MAALFGDDELITTATAAPVAAPTPHPAASADAGLFPPEEKPRFVVSARKYRPAAFDSVVGQGHVTTTLKNAIGSGKLAQAFLFCGPRGVGKTTCARILAKTINCTSRTADTEACNQCDSCRAFNQSASFNVHELDAASNNSVDDIRALVEQVRYAPQAGRYKVYIIDEVHMLSNAAFNAFLKTLEEPPSHAIFILATTERHKIIPTILSRCQTFDFNRIRPDDMVRHLADIAGKEGIEADTDGLHLIAQKADGGLRDALSIFDQIVTFSGGHITYRAVADNLHVLDYDTYFRLTDALLAESHAQALLLFDEVLRHGFDGHLFVTGWANHLRDLLVSQTPETVNLLEVADSVKIRYAQQAKAAPAAWLLSALTLAGACDRDYKQARHQRLHVELLLLRAAHLRGALNFATLELHGNGHAPSSSNGEGKKKTDNGPDVTLSAESRPTYGPPGLNAASGLPGHTQPGAVSNIPQVEIKAGASPPATVTAASAPPPMPTPVPSIPPAVTRPVAAAPLVAAPAGGPRLGMKLPGLADARAPQRTAAETAAATAEPTSTFGDEPVTTEAVLAVIRGLAQQQRQENRMTEYTIFNRDVAFDTRTLEVKLLLDNAVQLTQFGALKPELLVALRTQLRNGRVTVVAEVNQQPEVRRLYTDSEKLAYLTEKHPVLAELRERLHLEPNF